MSNREEACSNVSNTMITWYILSLAESALDGADIQQVQVLGVDECGKSGFRHLAFPAHAHCLYFDLSQTLHVVLANLREEVEHSIEAHELDGLCVENANGFDVDLLADAEDVYIDIYLVIFESLLVPASY